LRVYFDPVFRFNYTHIHNVDIFLVFFRFHLSGIIAGMSNKDRHEREKVVL